MMEPYEVGPIRPPSEAHSLLLRLTRNCPWNRCEFCPLYKGATFSRRTVADVKADIDLAAELYGGDAYKTAFLQDADSILMRTEDLVEILARLKKKFPRMERVTMYSRSATIARKSVEDLSRLRDAGLSRLHVGLESGYGPLLEFVKKGVTPEKAIDAGKKVKESGISLSEYVLLGLGGKRWSREHAEATAEALNAINPDYIRIRTLRVPEGTPLWDKLQSGEFQRLNDEDIIREERILIERLEGITSYLASDHSLNLLMQIKGQLPDAKADMLNTIDRYLALPEREKRLFELGRRMHIFHMLGDRADDERRARVEGALLAIESDPATSVDAVTFQLMGGTL
jgi:radical SAM superfamily enzyme YgiQ (UPF0313 family)